MGLLSHLHVQRSHLCGVPFPLVCKNVYIQVAPRSLTVPTCNCHVGGAGKGKETFEKYDTFTSKWGPACRCILIDIGTGEPHCNNNKNPDTTSGNSDPTSEGEKQGARMVYPGYVI